MGFLVCIACVAIWKTLKFECKEDHPNRSFRTSSLDVGITMYSGRKGNSCLSISGPKCVGSRIVRNIKNFFVPFLELWRALKKLAEARKKRPGGYEACVAISVGIVVYYVGWLFLILDPVIPVTDGNTYFVRGFANSTYNIEDVKISDRYGHFRLYTNDWAPDQRMVVAESYHPEYKENMAVGDRVGPPLRLAVFGFFFLFLFCCVVCAVRSSVRNALKIRGNLAEDALVSFFLWPMVLTQVNEALEEGLRNPKDENQEVKLKSDEVML